MTTPIGRMRATRRETPDEEGIEIPFPHRVVVTRGAKATDLPAAEGEQK